jgi:hypothetical protein
MIAVITRRCPGPEFACGEFGGSGGQSGGQLLTGERPSRHQQFGLLDPGLGLTFGQVQHPGQQPHGGTEPSDSTRLLRVQLGDHGKNPRIRPPQIGLGRTQPLQQPMNTSLGAILHQRGHATILPTTTDISGPNRALLLFPWLPGHDRFGRVPSPMLSWSCTSLSA